MREQYNILKEENTELRGEIVRLQCQNRRKNVKLFGIMEIPYESRWDCKRAILNALFRANIRLHPKAIESTYRAGPKIENRCRPVIVSMFHAEERNLLLSKAQYIWETTGVRVEEDFPPSIDAKRKILKPFLIAANKIKDQQKSKSPKATLNLDTLNMDGKTYSVNSINKLPINLQPQTLSTPTDGSTTGFFTSNSPLSNHHLADQVIDGRRYNCNEQYYMYMKAQIFGEGAIARDILRTTHPGKQKKLGRIVEDRVNFNFNVWKERKLEVMKEGGSINLIRILDWSSF